MNLLSVNQLTVKFRSNNQENEVVKKAITNISKTQNISENVIKNILIYEYEKSLMNK